MKNIVILAVGIGLYVGHSTCVAQDDRYWIVTGEDAAQSTLRSLITAPQMADAPSAFRILSSENGRSAVEITESVSDELHTVLHADFERCGGYTIHPSRDAALAEVRNPFYSSYALRQPLAFPRQIDQQDVVRPALNAVRNAEILDVVQSLQSFGTRYFQSEMGRNAAFYLRDHWLDLGTDRQGFEVELIAHGGWRQNSVVATLQGSSLPDEIVVIGAHLDSINASNHDNAPGADDDASGVAVVTEVLRVIMDSGFRPKRTMQFMAYAAEEVGLRGSREIAERYKDEGKTVVAALQMDMTGFRGSEKDMYLISDYVNLELTAFLKELINEYNTPGAHQITFGETECGYGCSDHVSWTRVGVPSAFPFEAKFSDYNPAIHSPRDTISNSDVTGAHPVRFAKLGIEFMMETAKSAAEPAPSGDNRYVYTTLRVIGNGSSRGCSYADWTCMANLCKSDLQDTSAWRVWAGCWRRDGNYQCYFECGQVKPVL